MSKDTSISLDFKNQISLTISLVVVLLCILLIPIYLTTGTSQTLTLYLLLTAGIINLIAYYFKKYRFTQLNATISVTILIMIRSYIHQSAMILAFIGLIIMLAAVFEDKKLIHIIFTISVLYIIYGLSIGMFTLGLTFPEGGKIPLVNNIQVSLPILISSYIISLLVLNRYIKTISLQEKEFIKLQEAQDILLTQAQLESMQIVSGGIAHDFNNLLTTIMGSVNLINLHVNELPEDVKEGLEDIYAASETAKNLANQLLNIVKADNSVTLFISDLNELIENTVRFSLKGRKSIVQYNLAKDLWSVNGDRFQLSQVIQNLVINADEAMDDKGVIIITTNNERLPDNNPYNVKKGNYIRISVKDNGKGMSEEIKSKLFNLFYSTKRLGSGIGLTVSKTIINSHMGYIGFNSIEYEGAEFYFFLPAVIESKISEVKEEKSNFVKIKGNVAIYEDNYTLTKILTRMLSQFDLNVFSASTEDEFLSMLQILKKENTSINFFILDLVLPGEMSGEKMAEKLFETWEDPYIIMSSGYSVEFIFKYYKQYKFNDLLRKPYSMDNLNTIIQNYVNFNKS
ncbi:MAG: response regulator [Candidatus Heimdallarchaeota archaeon]|nr:response regulator [Candidatus Heimdallarchaeota archaeon]